MQVVTPTPPCFPLVHVLALVSSKHGSELMLTVWLQNLINDLTSVCVCVCVLERERDKERGWKVYLNVTCLGVFCWWHEEPNALPSSLLSCCYFKVSHNAVLALTSDDIWPDFHCRALSPLHLHTSRFDQQQNFPSICQSHHLIVKLICSDQARIHLANEWFFSLSSSHF